MFSSCVHSYQRSRLPLLETWYKTLNSLDLKVATSMLNTYKNRQPRTATCRVSLKYGMFSLVKCSQFKQPWIAKPDEATWLETLQGQTM